MTNTDEPIYPDKDFGNIGATGLTKREYFAAMAMEGLCAFSGSYEQSWGPEDIANRSLSIADALIIELNKSKP